MNALASILRASQSAPLPRRFPLALAFLLAAAATFVPTAEAQTSTSAVPGFISYQGRVTNASGVVVGGTTPANRTIIFRIWGHQSNSTEGDLLYSEQQTVTISEGEFSVLIGAGTAVTDTPLGYSETGKGPGSTTLASAGVFGGATRYLGLTVDDGSPAADPEVSPRQRIVASAYALRAKYAESVGANGASTIIALDNGNVGIGATNPGARLEVAGSVRAGGAGIGNPAFSLLANSASTVAASVGYANSTGSVSSDSAAGDTVVRTDNGGKLLLQSGTGASAVTIGSNNFVGIQNKTPGFPLNFAATLGDKISLYGSSGAHFGFGIQPALLQIHTDFNHSDIAFGYGTSASMTEIMRIKGNGNVGIGTASPGARLQVSNGSTHFQVMPGMLNGSANANAVTLDLAGINGTTSVWDDFVVSGNVGIGTTAPSSTVRLDVVTTGSSQTAAKFQSGANAGTASWIHHGVLGDIYWRSFATNGRVILQDTGGIVGIGTNNPTRGKLEVVGSATASVGAYGFLNSSNTGTVSGTQNIAYGVFSDSRIAATEFNAFSDRRIKEIQGRSDGAADLATLMQVEVTDYRYKDTVAKGTALQKKLIGQQVEQVYPQAVNRSTDVVPDIFQMAKVDAGWIELAGDLKPGDRVQLVTDAGAKVHDVVVVENGRFRAVPAPDGDKVFVYGREVSDFRNVDYDAVAMLNVSATQEIKREKDAEIAALRERLAALQTRVDDLHSQNAELTGRLAGLEAKDRTRDAKLAAIERFLSSERTVMARPAARTSAGEQE